MIAPEDDGRSATEEEKALETLRREDALTVGYLTRVLDAPTRDLIKAKHAKGASWQIWGCNAGFPTTEFRGAPGFPDLHPYFLRLSFGQTALDSITVEIARTFGVICTGARQKEVGHESGLSFWVPGPNGQVRPTGDRDDDVKPFWMWPDSRSWWVTYEPSGTLRALPNLFGRDREAADLPVAVPPAWFTQGYFVPSPGAF